MTLQDLSEFLLAAYRDTTHPLAEGTITKCLLRAYDMGKEDGDSAPTSCVACMAMVRPRVQAKMYCSVQCKARLSMRRTRARRKGPGHVAALD